jgi:hypothetical protein
MILFGHSLFVTLVEASVFALETVVSLYFLYIAVEYLWAFTLVHLVTIIYAFLSLLLFVQVPYTEVFS